MGTIAYGEAVSWRPIQEDLLFTEEGLKYVANLVELPEDVKSLENTGSQGNDGVDLEMKCHFSADQTAKELKNLFSTQTSPFSRYFRFRQHALEQLWLKRKELKNKRHEKVKRNVTVLNVDKEDIDFSSRVSLLLLIPLIKSHSKTDPALAEHSTVILFHCLKECSPNSLGSEPQSCITGLADLLTEWLFGENYAYDLSDTEEITSYNKETINKRVLVQKETVVSCLLSLACARLSLRLFVKTLYTIRRTKENLALLPVAKVFAKTVQYEKCGWHSNPSILLTSCLEKTWQYIMPHSSGCMKGDVISSDGKYLYVGHGSCFIKLGSGKQGSLRGHVYCSNTGLSEGYLCFVKGKLVYRPKALEKSYQQFADIIDTTTLKVTSPVEYMPNEKSVSSVCGITTRKTVNLITDGVLLYWLYYVDVPSNGNNKATSTMNASSSQPTIVDIYLDVLEMKESGDKYVVMSIQEPVILKYKIETTTTHDFPMALAMRPVSAAHSTQDEYSKSSCGLNVDVLQRTPIITDGVYIIMLIGHPNYQGYPLCKAPFNRCYSIADGKFVRDDNLIDISVEENIRWQYISLASTGICYDTVNNMLWTSSENCIEEWSNIGAMSYHHIVHKLSPKQEDYVTDDGDMMTPFDCMTAVALQISFLCATINDHNIISVDNDPNCDFTLDEDYEKYLLHILGNAVRQQDIHVLHSVLILIQTLFSQAFLNNKKVCDTVVAEMRFLLLKVIMSDPGEYGDNVQHQACNTLRSGLGIFYPSEQSALMMILLNEPGESGVVFLKESLLRESSEALRNGPINGCTGWFAEDTVSAIIEQCTEESCYFILLAKEGNARGYELPCISPLLDYVKSLVTTVLEELFIGGNVSYHVRSLLLQYCEDATYKLMHGSILRVSKSILEAFANMEGKGTVNLEEKLNLLHNAIKSSMYQQVMPVLLTALANHRISNLIFCKLMVTQLMELTILHAKIASFHRKLCPLRHGSSKNLGQVRCFFSPCEKDTKVPYDKVPIPKPWLVARPVHSMHPVSDEYKLQRTVSLFGAKMLYLKFDERCATQYDYDKLIVYAGHDDTCPKIGEYSGNTYGYGGRSVVKTGWPKESVKVNGNVVTLVFETKSTRERATPDKAVWGFSCTITADYEYQKTRLHHTRLEFFIDVALSSSYLTYFLLNSMYVGPSQSEEELRCSHLLKTKLLQRCIWEVWDSQRPDISSDFQSSMKLSSNVVDKLRSLCGGHRPTLRPSIHQVVQPMVVETLVLSGAIKHCGLGACVGKLELESDGISRKKEFCYLFEVAEEVFLKVDCLVRKLQAMAELEKKWWQEIQDISKENIQPSAAFFNDYHLQQEKAKELELLCHLKEIKFDPFDHEKTVGKLIQLLEQESSILSHDERKMKESQDDIFPKSKAYVHSIRDRAELLLNVTIMDTKQSSTVNRSFSNIEKVPTDQGGSRLLVDSPVARSVSAPHLDSNGDQLDQKGLGDLRRFREWDVTLRNIYKATHVCNEPRRSTTTVVEQMLTFIASTPDPSISCGSFLTAARTRWRRGKYRQLAILHLSKMISVVSALGVTGVHLLGVVVSILSQGTRLHELECGGMLNGVRNEFGVLLRHIVDQSVGMLARHCEKLIILATTPFTLCSRQDVLRSSLILMINKLCSSSHMDTGLLDLSQRHHAWCSFQVLIDRLVSWETDQDHDPREIEWSGVARQVATVLTNYLKYLENKIGRHDVNTCTKDPLHEVLELLQRIAKSHLGQCVLTQPQMIKILLSVVTERQASPKHMLTALTLLHSALPLTDPDNNELLHSPSMEALPNVKNGRLKPSHSVIKMLLNKLGELLLPYQHSENCDTRKYHSSSGVGNSVFSVFVHNRGDIPAHEIVQKVLSSSGQPFLFQVGLGSQMERAISLNRELSEQGFAEVLTDKMAICLKQATRLAQSGICVSISPSQDMKGMLAQSTTTHTDNQLPETVCYDRNKSLVSYGNIRPYVSGNVAHNMASEVVTLLRNLLCGNTAWSKAVKHVLFEGLDNVVTLIQQLDETSASETEASEWFLMAQQVLATLCSLGGFKETIRSGCTALVTGEGLFNTSCYVQAVSSDQEMARIMIDKPADYETYIERSFDVPLSNLSVPTIEVLSFVDEVFIQKLITAVNCILKDNTSLQPAPSVFSNNTEVDLEALRTLAEVKTRALALLDTCTRDESTGRALLQTPPDILHGLFEMAQSLDPGERQTIIENHCEELRGVFKEYVRPVSQDVTAAAAAAAAKQATTLPHKLDIIREFPLVRGCVFSRELTSVHYVNDPTDNHNPAQPRGVLIYADKPFPDKMLSYYWEADIVSLGDSDSCETGPHLSFGFLPSSVLNQETWIMPTGSCLIHSNGRAIHYTDGGALSWQVVNLNLTMKEHDVIGCGWQKQENEFDTRVVGRVFFTRNGKLITDDVLSGIPSSLYPVVHIQKKNVRVSVNFGVRNFRYQDGKQEFHGSKTQSCSEEETRMVLQELPFSNCDDIYTCVGEERAGEQTDEPLATSSLTDLSGESTVSASEKEYDTSISQQEFLTSSYDQMLNNGPAKFMALDEEGVCGNGGSGGSGSSNGGGKRARQSQKDPRNALVKAWETKVFPTIRRRFRSEVDRRSGLDQIRGALMEGLIDIAISTVEDLYEDSGGLPNTLLFPRLEDIQAELDKTTVDDIQQGMNVLISSSSLESLPCFAVSGMSKTFGLNGVVQNIDKRNELVLTDVYVRDEGMVVRYWYPVEFLKPHSPCLGRLSSLTLVNQREDNYEVYSELWTCERTLSKMYSRSAVINLLTHMRREAWQDAYDIDHIHFMAGDLLRTPQSDGGIIVRNITSTSSLKECLKTTSCSPTTVFFKHEHRLKQRIVKLINSCINDEAKLKDVCMKMCSVLKESGSIAHKQYSVTNVKMRSDIQFSEAAVLTASCHGTNDYFISRVRIPSVQIYGYYGRRRITRDGSITKYNIAQYPDFNCTLSGSVADGKCLNPERLLPCNRCHIRYGSNNSKGLVAHIHGLPLSFITCLAFIEQFVQYCCVSTTMVNTTTVLLFHELFAMIEKFLSTMSTPPMIREMIFHILAQILRLVTKLDCNEHLKSFVVKHATFLMSLKLELLKLVEKEVSISRAVALEYVLNCNFEKVKFSSYSQALIEVMIAVAQMNAVVCPDKHDSSSRLKDSDIQQEEETSELTEVQVDHVNPSSLPEDGSDGNLTIQLYNGNDSNPGSFVPFFSSLPYANEGERLAMQAENMNRAARSSSLRRQRIRDKKRRKRTSPVHSPETRSDDSTEHVSPPWFERLVNTISILRHLVQQHGTGKIATIEKLVTSVSIPSQAWERVLVITNIPTSVDNDMVVEGITKAARPGGGLRDDTDVFIEEEKAICIAAAAAAAAASEEHTPTEAQCYKSAVVQFKTGVHLDRIRARLQQDKLLTSGNTSGNTLQVLKVNSLLLFDGGWSVTKACLGWETFLMDRLLDDGNEQGFQKDAMKTFKEIFLSCCMTSCDQPEDTPSSAVMVDKVLVSEEEVDKPTVGNLLQVFLKALPDRKKSWKDELTELFEKYGKIKDGSEDSVKLLPFSGFLDYLRELIKSDKRVVWRALLACGYNFEHERSTVVFSWEVEKEHEKWCLNDDKILVEYIDEISKNFSTSPQRLCPEEIFLESELTNPAFYSLQRFSRRSIGSRFVLYKSLNQSIQRLVLPVIDLRVSQSHCFSTAGLLCSAKDLLFRTTKVSELNRVLDLSAHRSADESSPEVSLDPLETLEADKVATTGPQMYQVARQLCKIASAKLRVKVATGGDPSFPLRVNLRGEQVLGLGGAYRHFMWIMAREAQSSHLGLLIPCPSAAANRNKGKYILRPAPMTLSEQQLLIFFGQLLGIALRSDIPLALDILPSFWKSLLGLPLEDGDLREADILTYNYIKRLSQISVKEDFERLCAEADISGTRFVFTSLTGEEVPLCDNGSDVLVTWDNHLEYATAVKKYRLDQLTCASRVFAIRTGLATIIPIHILSILSPSDLEVRTCGIPNVDIDFLKVHTTYVAGIRSTDKHIEFFWDTLESFSLDQQRKFIKFACNQERLPGRCSCQDGTSDIHVPPYPMKIGPPDGRGPPDQRYIRVETCMFMVKLPRYTTLSVMKEKLLYAMNCREDPLTDYR